MGIDVDTVLYPGTTARQVAVTLRRLTGADNSSVISSTVATCSQIRLDFPPGNTPAFYVLFQHEWRTTDGGNGTPFGPPGCPGFKLRATARNIAISVGVITALGGWSDFNDCDDSGADYHVQRPPLFLQRKKSDREHWAAVNSYLEATQALTREQIECRRAVASYLDGVAGSIGLTSD